ncbi:MAG: formate dehydrogenase accessory protein [Methanocella sp. PtaU1.Bin125]|nr:MAG: formate dehydrogenase accessory protein [Methanocella sp. PtaU1.Bin125]
MSGEIICDAAEISGGICTPVEVHICEDRPIRIYLNGALAGAFETCPVDMEALAYGYLLCEGLVAPASGIKPSKITIKVKSDVITVEADPVASPSPARAQFPGVDVGLLFERYVSLNRYSPLCRSTGGTHCAVLFTAYGGAVSSAEDLHAFGAVSKAIGKAMLNGYDPGSCFLLFTGKATPWTVQAAANAGLPLVVCCSPPTSRAIAVARKTGIGLVCVPGPGWMAVFHGDHLLTGLPEPSSMQAVWPMSPGSI